MRRLIHELIKTKHRPLLGYSLITFLIISPICVQVNDRQSRKEEINNAAQSLGEQVLWKKIEKAKEAIDQLTKRSMHCRIALKRLNIGHKV